MKRASFTLFVGLLLLVLAASAATAKNNGRGTATASETCGTKFSLVPTDSRLLGSPILGGRLNTVATNVAGQVLAAGSYQEPQIKKGVFTSRKRGLVQIWDPNEIQNGEKMLAIPVNLGGFENEFNWVASDPAGGFWLVGTIWEETPKGPKSKIVVGRFDHGFKREAVITITLPGSVRNIPHRILVVGQTVWVTGYFTKKFGEPPTALKPEWVQMDRPYPAFKGGEKKYFAYVKPGGSKTYPPYTKGEAKAYPLLVQVQGSSWNQVRFPGEGWLDGLASRGEGHLVVVGMANRVAAAYELKETWRSVELPRSQATNGISYKGRAFIALLDVMLTPKGMILSRFDVVFSGYGAERLPSGFGGIIELTEKGVRYLGSTGPEILPQVKVLIPSLPGHGGPRFYGVGRPYVESNRGGSIGRAIQYPGYRESDYPFQFKAEGIATTQTEVWVVGALNRTGGSGSWQTAVMRVCPPLKAAAGPPEVPPPPAAATETP